MLADCNKRTFIWRASADQTFHDQCTLEVQQERITKWSKACDEEIGQVNIIHSLREWMRTVLSRGKAQHHNANLDCFKMLTLLVTWRIPNQREEECRWIVGSHTFVPVGSGEKQTALSHSGTEAEVISLGAGSASMMEFLHLACGDIVT